MKLTFFRLAASFSLAAGIIVLIPASLAQQPELMPGANGLVRKTSAAGMENPQNSPQGHPGSTHSEVFSTTRFPGRSIYLNGTNISSSRNETLQNVNVRIDEHGNIYLEASHYEAVRDTSYHPLLSGELPKLPKPLNGAGTSPQLSHDSYSKQDAWAQPNGPAVPEQRSSNPVPPIEPSSR